MGLSPLSFPRSRVKPLTILVDVDEIVADTLPAWMLRIYEKTGVLATAGDITNWDLMQCTPYQELNPADVFDILGEPGFHLELPTLPGACEELKRLHTSGHKVYFVTARYGSVGMPETLAWFRNNFPWVDPQKQVVFCRHKHILVGDVLIDDKPANLADYRQAHPAAELITISYPYNQLTVDGVYRAPYGETGWSIIREHIESLAKVEHDTVH